MKKLIKKNCRSIIVIISVMTFLSCVSTIKIDRSYDNYNNDEYNKIVVQKAVPSSNIISEYGGLGAKPKVNLPYDLEETIKRKVSNDLSNLDKNLKDNIKEKIHIKIVRSELKFLWGTWIANLEFIIENTYNSSKIKSLGYASQINFWGFRTANSVYNEALKNAIDTIYWRKILKNDSDQEIEVSNSLEGAIAVIEFKPINDEARRNSLHEIVANEIENKLFEDERFTVIEREDIDELIKEQKLKLTGLTEKKESKAIGAFLEADYLLMGTVAKLNEIVLINLKIVDVVSSEVVYSTRVSAKKEENIIDSINYIFN